ncbi:MAG: helix-turn-helix domain-containing protein [Clostridia bacterium]|nr:helix-turn-helix domain-containing protein [Clostridia bacterium]
MTKLYELRKSKNISMMQAAKELSLPYTTYVNYEKGVREPSSEILIKIANYFGVSVDYLIGRSEMKNGYAFEHYSPQIAQDTITFPVIGDIAAGFDKIAVESWSGETIEVPASYLKGRNKDDFLVLAVKGDSMYPFYLDGDKVLILKQSTVANNGDIAAVIYDDECATLKKVELISNDYIKLVPINPLYQPIEIKGEAVDHCRIIGIPRLLVREVSKD